MKALILFMLIFSNITYGSEYICTREINDPKIILKSDSQNYKFQFFRQGQLQLSFSVPTTALNTFHENRSIGPVLSFVPGWGETDGSIYGRFSETGAVFDIYVSGMAGQVVTTLTNYNCKFQQ